MKIPDNYIVFSNSEEKQAKYKEWGFKSGKNNEIPFLIYKGIYDTVVPQECDIIGYYNDVEILIELQESKQRIVIDRRYLKQMQSKSFNINSTE